MSHFSVAVIVAMRTITAVVVVLIHVIGRLGRRMIMAGVQQSRLVLVAGLACLANNSQWAVREWVGGYMYK